MTGLKIGDRVCFAGIYDDDYGYQSMTCTNYNSNVHFGTITDIQDNDVTVKWDKDWVWRKPKQFEINEFIMSEDQFKTLVNYLEEDYASLIKTLSPKIAEAAALIKEAGKMCKDKGGELEEIDRFSNEIESALDAAGWQTSSFYC